MNTVSGCAGHGLFFDVCIDNVPLTMLPLAKVLSTEATAEWMVAEGILQTIIVNYDLSSFFDANGSH